MTPELKAIGVVVPDMPAAVAFYRRLGLTFAGATDSHMECELPGGLRLMLDTEESVRSFSPDWVTPSGSPRSALAFDCGTPAAVDTTYQELTGAGYRGDREPWDAVWGMRYASILDPGGNGVDLYAALPQKD